MKKVSTTALFVLFSCMVWAMQTQAQEPFEYLSPRPNAEYVSTGTTLAVRHGADIQVSSINQDVFVVEGSKSGLVSGEVILADDQKTVIFKPDDLFEIAETVTVTVQAGLQTTSGETLGGVSYQFQTSLLPLLTQQARAREFRRTELLSEYGADSVSSREARSETVSQYATLPADFPAITITVPASDEVDDGYLFMTTGSLPFPDYGYNLIFDNEGEPIYYYREPNLTADFKKQPNGNLSYCYLNLLNVNLEAGECYQLNPQYEVIETIQAGNGYVIDFHGIQINRAGYKLIQIYDPQQVDMSQIVAGGVPTATVFGTVVQELDPSNNVIFEWRSWDDIPITDAADAVDLTTSNIDATHVNSVEWGNDGHVIVSNRHLDEMTKIDRHTGQIIWRMGGKGNQFTFVNEDNPALPFSHQHDARQIDNGNYTLYDNGNEKVPPYSRAVEYQLDEENLVATKTWEYRNQPNSIFAPATGNAQRLPNGNTLVGWGGVTIGGLNRPILAEVKPDGTKLFEAYFSKLDSTYRVFRQTWVGRPAQPPTLVLRDNTLHYSWNGATHVSVYKVYQGDTMSPETLIDTAVKTGFETTTVLTSPPVGCTYYRVLPLDEDENETISSNVVFAGSDCERIATLLPESDTTHDFSPQANDTLLTTTLTAPMGAVSQTVQLHYTAWPSATHAAPANMRDAGMVFSLIPQGEGLLPHPFNFNHAISLTLQYGDIDLDETTLMVYYWDDAAQAWSSEGLAVTARDPEANRLTFTTMHLTEFAVFGSYTTLNLVADGGFEQGKPNPYWQTESSNSNPVICDGGCSYDGIPQSYRGDHWTRFNSHPTNAETATVSQNLSMPTGEVKTAALVFWLRVTQSNGTGLDTLTVKLGNTVLFTATDALTYSKYTKVTVDISAMLTADLPLTFEAAVEAGSLTQFDIDEVSLVAQGVFPPSDTAITYLPLIIRSSTDEAAKKK